MAAPASWPTLPARAAYLVLNNAARRNALSREELLSLRRQVLAANTSARSGRALLLPAFRPEVLSALEASVSESSPSAAAHELAWLTSSRAWAEERAGLPNVLVLRSAGPVFSAGHDLGEMRRIPADEARATFALCAEVMGLLRRSPIPVVGVIQGLATAAGCQLALSTDLPVTHASARLQLPGAVLGLPCSSPSTIVSRRLGHGFAYRMLALAEPVRADQLPASAGIDIVPDPADLDARVAAIVDRLASRTPPRPQALAKWAYWTQIGLNGAVGADGPLHGTAAGTGGAATAGGDGYEDALDWTGRVMALHAQSDEAQEGIEAFLDKRPPKWML